MTNTKRGLMRLFVLLAVLWMIGMGWQQFGSSQKQEDSMTISLGNDTQLRIDASGIKQQDANEEQMKKLMLVFLPALALLLAVPVMGWVAGGFKPEGK